MKIAITDANIFIDLFYLNSQNHLFGIGFEIITTQQVMMEMEDQHTPELKKLCVDGLLKNLQACRRR